MVIVKNNRIFIPIAALIILIGLIVTLAVFKSLFRTIPSGNDSQNRSSTTGIDTAVSSEEIYFQGAITTQAGVPQRTVTDPKENHGLSVYWIQGSQTGGSDTCTLYNSTTNRIYATSYQTNGQLSGRPTGSMYYQNNTIKQDKSLSLLEVTCFKN